MNERFKKVIPVLTGIPLLGLALLNLPGDVQGNVQKPQLTVQTSCLNGEPVIEYSAAEFTPIVPITTTIGSYEGLIVNLGVTPAGVKYGKESFMTRYKDLKLGNEYWITLLTAEEPIAQKRFLVPECSQP